MKEKLINKKLTVPLIAHSEMADITIIGILT